MSWYESVCIVVGSVSGISSSVLLGVGLSLLLDEGSDCCCGGNGCGICTGGAILGSGLMVSYRPVGNGVVSGLAMKTVNP